MSTFDMGTFSPSPNSYGNKGSMIDYSGGDVTFDAESLKSIKAVVVCSAGDVVYLPKGESSGDITITYGNGGVPLPHIPGTIRDTSTATLCTVED